MSESNIPTTYVPSVYNPADWINTSTSGITQAQLNTALATKLDYPTAQGAEALANGTTATTQASSDNSTKVATTAYVKSNIPAVPSSNVYNYPQIWNSSNFYQLGSPVPMNIGSQTCKVIFEGWNPAQFYNNSTQGVSALLEISYCATQVSSNGGTNGVKMFNFYSIYQLILAPFDAALGTSGVSYYYFINVLGTDLLSNQQYTYYYTSQTINLNPPISLSYNNGNQFSITFNNSNVVNGANAQGVCSISSSVRIINSTSYNNSTNQFANITLPNNNGLYVNTYLSN